MNISDDSCRKTNSYHVRLPLKQVQCTLYDNHCLRFCQFSLSLEELDHQLPVRHAFHGKQKFVLKITNIRCHHFRHFTVSARVAQSFGHHVFVNMPEAHRTWIISEAASVSCRWYFPRVQHIKSVNFLTVFANFFTRYSGFPILPFWL